MCSMAATATIERMDMTPRANKNTAAFFAQAGLTFALSLGAMLLAIVYMTGDPWPRAFLAMGTIFLVSSSFTLAKCIRDAQERTEVYQHLDQARMDRSRTEHRPYYPVA